MGRTPWYNETGGKDHWSVTSMMALGSGIQGDRVIGGTSVDPISGFDQTPLKIEPVGLTPSEEGLRIRPQHIHQSLRTHLGIADHPHTQRFDLGLPAEEHFPQLFAGNGI
jgi:hypothetical protein